MLTGLKIGIDRAFRLMGLISGDLKREAGLNMAPVEHSNQLLWDDLEEGSRIMTSGWGSRWFI